MLKLRLTLKPAGVPAGDAYRRAVDVLSDEHGNNIGEFSRGMSPPLPLAPGLAATIDAWLARRGKGRCVLMVHGYDFDPSTGADDDDDPFRRIYAAPGQELVAKESWLPIAGETDENGAPGEDIAIAFGWTSAGDLSAYGQACFSNSYQYAVLDCAPLAARALAVVIAALADRGVPVDILAHSLGTRPALQAIRILASNGVTGAVRRAVLMGGAEFSVDARDAMEAATLEVFNIVIRGDDVLRAGAVKFCFPFREVTSVESRVIGRDGMRPAANWLDIQLDKRGGDVVRWLVHNGGYQVSAEPTERGNHWSYYRHGGNRRLFHDILANPDMNIAWFRDRGVPEGVARHLYGELPDTTPITPLTAQARNNSILKQMLVADLAGGTRLA